MFVRSHADVRSYYFRHLVGMRDEGDRLAFYTLSDFRPLWREANLKAKEWRRQATNRFNHQTQRWEQGQ
jgi:hypothetical protein